MIYLKYLFKTKIISHECECELLIINGSEPSTSTSWLLLRVWLKYSREGRILLLKIPIEEKKRKILGKRGEAISICEFGTGFDCNNINGPAIHLAGRNHME